MKVFSLVLLSTCYMLAAVSAQGFNQNRGINDVPLPFSNQFRRQLNTQQALYNDAQQQHQQQQLPRPQQGLFLQQSPSVEIPLLQQARHQQQQQQQRFPNQQPQTLQHQQQQQFQNNQNNQQFQRNSGNQIPHYQPQPPQHFQHPQQQQQLSTQQQPPAPAPLDIHHQNFLALRNFASQQVGPQQSLPQRSYNNKPFQNGPPAYSTLPSEVYQQQLPNQQQTFNSGSQVLPQTQQKLPLQAPVPTFQTHSAPQKPFSTQPQIFGLQPEHPHSTQQTFLSQNQQKLSQQQQQQQQQFVLTPNLGLPVPQLPFANNIQSTAFPAVQQQQQHQQQHQQQQFGVPQFSVAGQPAQSPDQEYKQKLIQKHEQFVQKQYEKSQNKVKQQHAEFLAKQQTIKQQVIPTIVGNPQQQQIQPQIYQQNTQQQQQQFNYLPNRSRPVGPSELPNFASAVQKYYQEHPTTTTTTSTTTTTTTPSTTTHKIHSKPVYNEIKADPGKFGQKVSKKPVKTFGRDELLKQLKAALAEQPQKDLGNKTYEEMDLVLPNGERVQVIRTNDPELVKGQQAYTQDQLQSLFGEQGIQAVNGGSSGKLSIADVAPDSKKDLVLPGGGKVQILRSPNNEEIVDPQNLPGGVDLSSLASLYGGSVEGVSNGANSIASSAVIQSDSDEPPSLEELAKRGLIPDGYEIEGLSSQPKAQPQPAPTLPPKKKATYVYLEEQSDGSFKIQGVKANGEKETKQTGAEVESILERIRSGEIKLPPSVTRLTLPNDEVVEIESGNIVKTTQRPTTTSTTTTTTTTTTAAPPTTRASTHRYFASRNTTPYYQSTTPTPQIHRSSTTKHYDHSSHRSTPSSRYTAAPTTAPVYIPTTYRAVTEHHTEASIQHSALPAQYSDAVVEESEHQDKASEVNIQASISSSISSSSVPALLTESADSMNPSDDLIQILKTNGLFAMAKYLKQSGLDSILNETGPYTIFVPTDKAFKNLLVQLGGPERAEEKFKANPRLLSGLLLHHVIPGAFEIATLQDEMTGVSLAGTQLRVNQYNMHDQEWNDVTLTTINGAMVVLNKKDIKIPQGIAHAVDRVMFPLPVGDLLQTLQSDRENRFSTFLKILYTSGLSEKLQSKGIKTYTVFAPVDKSFTEIESDTLEKLMNNKEVAEEFAMKHIVPGTLFSAGMRFYQVKDSLFTGKTVILQKTSAGKIKVNDTQMVASNIPATNGVIHALDGVLA